MMMLVEVNEVCSQELMSMLKELLIEGIQVWNMWKNC